MGQGYSKKETMVKQRKMEISALVPIQSTVLATTTPFLTSTCTAGVCKEECTGGIFLAYTKKRVHLNSKIVFQPL